MLQAILSHTPHWVWPLLAYLLYRGWIARHDREAGIIRVMLLPLVMLGLAVQGLLARALHDPEVLIVTLVAVAAGVTWAWQRTPFNVTVPSGGASIFVRGSWRPLAMTVFIFALKYSVGVTQAIHPLLLQSLMMSLSIAVLYGGFAGLSLGRVLRIWHLYRQAQSDFRPAASGS